MIISRLSLFALLSLAICLGALGCERKAPTFVPAKDYGKEAMLHFDTMKGQPKYIRIKKRELRSKEAIERRRIAREQARGVYRKQNPWDY